MAKKNEHSKNERRVDVEEKGAFADKDTRGRVLRFASRWSRHHIVDFASIPHGKKVPAYPLYH